MDFVRRYFVPRLAFFEIGRRHFDAHGGDDRCAAQTERYRATVHFNLSVPACARAFGENQHTLPASEHGVDFFQHFHAFVVGDVAGSDNLAFHAGVVQQVFFDQYVRVGKVADQQNNI